MRHTKKYHRTRSGDDGTGITAETHSDYLAIYNGFYFGETLKSYGLNFKYV